MDSSDVIIAGGGPGGLAAALTAGRTGARVLLLEQGVRLGGMLRDGLHFPLCGLFANGDPMPQETLNGGVARELFHEMSTHLQPAIVTMGRTHVCPAPLHQVVRWFEDRISALSNVKVLRETCVTGLSTRGGIIESCETIRPGSQPSFAAKTFVDGTGSGAILKLGDAGQAPVAGDKDPLSGASIMVTGLTPDPMLALKVPLELRKVCDEEGLPRHIGFTVFARSEDESCGYLKLNAPSGTPLEALSTQVLAILQRRIPAFHGAVPGAASPCLMPRSGARLQGDYILSRHDVLAGRKFADAAAKAAWPMEYWDPKDGPRYEYPPDGDYYEIPARCLHSSRLHNLFAAGRCLSADSEAQASARVMGTCLTLGESAGMMAAKAADTSQP